MIWLAKTARSACCLDRRTTLAPQSLLLEGRVFNASCSVSSA